MNPPHRPSDTFPSEPNAGLSEAPTAAAPQQRGLAGWLLAARRPEVSLRVLLAATMLTCAIFLANAFVVPGSAYAIQDDARQFLAWTARLTDIPALKGDLIADYWHSVTPRALRAFYGVLAMAGIPPLVLARLIPVALLLASAFFAFRAAMVLTRERALAALVVAATVMALLVHEDSIFTSTARAFSPPLFLMFLDGLLRDKRWQVVLALGILAAVYPTTALVGLTMLGFATLRLRQWPPFDTNPRALATVVIATLAVAAPILTLPGEVQRWEPVITIADALTMPNLGTPGGRSSIVPLEGTYPFLCSARVGILPEIVPCWATRWATPLNALLLLPLLILGVGAARRAWRGEPRSPDIIYFWAVIAGAMWWAVATIFAFKLHLPARYPQRVLSILEWMAIGQMIGMWLDQRFASEGASGRVRAAAVTLMALFAVSFATPTPGIRRPLEPQAMEWLRASPATLQVGGLSSDLDFVPAITGRATHVTVEHAIPYHLTYFREIDRRLVATVEAFTTPDAAMLAGFVEAEGLDVLLVDRAFIESGDFPDDYAGVVPAAVAEGEARLAAAPSALQRKAKACAIIEGEAVWLLDAKCLAARAPAA
ncbi:MAG: hypothetical protein ACXIUO_11505 [Erythrobacter sp.]